jgi:hypothetical protein
LDLWLPDLRSGEKKTGKIYTEQELADRVHDTAA